MDDFNANLKFIRDKLIEIDEVNDKNQNHIIDLFKLTSELNKTSRTQIKRELKALQGLVIGLGAIGFLFFGHNNSQIERVSNKFVDTLIDNMDKIVALGISGVAGYKVFTADKQAKKEEDEIADNVLAHNNIYAQERVVDGRLSNDKS